MNYSVKRRIFPALAISMVKHANYKKVFNPECDFT